jgi:hypothetical protein
LIVAVIVRVAIVFRCDVFWFGRELLKFQTVLSWPRVFILNTKADGYNITSLYTSTRLHGIASHKTVVNGCYGVIKLHVINLLANKNETESFRRIQFVIYKEHSLPL